MGIIQRSCAYCSSLKNLSREHIFPDGVIKRFDENMLSINDKSDKVFKSDLVVKDVCETCNNGVLSNLDNKFIQLFEDNMLQPLDPGDSVEFNYNYDDLLRVLLKISYNSARASKDGHKAVAALRKHVPYILGKVDSASGVTLRLQIVTSSKRFNTETNQVEGIMQAKLLRSCKVSYNGPQHSNFMIRLLAFNSFWFYMIIPLKPVSLAKINTFVDGFVSSYHLSGIPLGKETKTVKIPKERTTYMHPNLLEGMRRKQSV